MALLGVDKKRKKKRQKVKGAGLPWYFCSTKSLVINVRNDPLIHIQ